MAIVHRRSRPAVPGETPALAGPAAQADPGAREWFGAARSARIRIVASFLVLLVVSGAGSLIAIRQVLLAFAPRLNGAFRIRLREPGPKVEPPLRLRIEQGEGVSAAGLPALEAELLARLRSELRVSPAISM